DPYHWHELRTESVDVLVSGQTFEHTEFFWETIFEIARVLKPGGLCCIIAPATGNEHRFPLDCWRILADGFRALARYAGLEIVHSHTHWEELAKYDAESNKWHESILIARKRAESLGTKMRRRLFAAARSWLSLRPEGDETLIQIFYTADGVHREEASLVAGVEQGGWREVRINLPVGASAAPLRIDFMRTLDFIEIARLSVSTAIQEYFSATTAGEFEKVTVQGDAERVPHPERLRLRITGVDPQLVLPGIGTTSGDERLRVEMRLRVFSER